MSPTTQEKAGVLVSLEGIDGGGKTSLAAFLAQYLEVAGIPYVLSREPGGTWLGEQLRPLLQSDVGAFSLHAEFFLFLAARVQHYIEVIAPALAEGKVVILDRYIDSTAAYQGDAFPLPFILDANERATGQRRPDITLLLDLDTDTALSRIGVVGGDRFEQRERLQQARSRFLTQATLFRDRIKVIKAAQPIQAVRAEALEHLSPFLEPWLESGGG